MRTPRWIFALFGLVALLGCQSGSVPVAHEEHGFDDGVDVDLGADPWRQRRRMDVGQLDRSIRTVTGGIGWDTWRRNGTTWEVSARQFEAFSDTLGVPDYINGTSEDLAVSLLFLKFLDDASRAVCRRLADREAGSGQPYDGEPQGTFAPVDLTAAEPPTQAQIDEALSHLLLRFHGRQVAVGSDALRPWRELHARLAATEAGAAAPERAWEGVCVALFTHPDFFTY
jgi:hypothetical protein